MKAVEGGRGRLAGVMSVVAVVLAVDGRFCFRWIIVAIMLVVILASRKLDAKRVEISSCRQIRYPPAVVCVDIHC